MQKKSAINDNPSHASVNKFEFVKIIIIIEKN